MLIAAVLPASASAQVQTYTREYTYRAGDADSRLTARGIALAEIRKLLLGEIATYVESRLERQVLEDARGLSDRTEEGVVSLIAGIVQVQVIEERWTGVEYWVKAQLRVDPAKVQAELEQLVRTRQAERRQDAQGAQPTGTSLAEQEVAEIRRLLEAQRQGEGTARSSVANDSLRRLEARVRELEARTTTPGSSPSSVTASVEPRQPTPLRPSPAFASPLPQSDAPLEGDLLDDIPLGAPQENAVAVIIGNATYAGDVPPAKYAVNDAEVMMQYAVRALGIRPSNIFRLDNATLRQMQLVFGAPGNPNGRLRASVRPGVTDVFVFYSGHGAPDLAERKPYLLPVDADVASLSLTGFAVDVLLANLAALGARQVTVVLDAGFSGASGGGDMMIRSASLVSVPLNDAIQHFQGRNAAVLFADGGAHVANWHDDQQHGLFTYFFLKGLQGAADGNQDGVVQLEEMRAYLTDLAYGVPYEARRLYHRDQRPSVIGPGQLELRKRPMAPR